MNERMYELINQCFIGTTDGKLSDLNTVANVEKFAELIVKKCVGRIKLQYQMDESTPEWIYNTLQEDIKEYFGVEE